MVRLPELTIIIIAWLTVSAHVEHNFHNQNKNNNMMFVAAQTALTSLYPPAAASTTTLSFTNVNNQRDTTTSANVSLSILFAGPINDHWGPTSLSSLNSYTDCTPLSKSSADCVGGIFRLSSYRTQVANRNINSPLFTFSVGAFSGGTFFGRLGAGVFGVHYLNLLGLDAAVLGSTELQPPLGPNITMMVQAANFPFLAANLAIPSSSSSSSSSASSSLPWVSSLVFHRSGVTIGVIGLSSSNDAVTTSLSSLYPMVTVLDQAAAVQVERGKLDDQGCQIIVVLVQSEWIAGFDQVAPLLEGVDIVLYESPSASVAPEVRTFRDISNAPVLAVGCPPVLRFACLLDLTFNSVEGTLEVATYTSTVLNGSVPIDQTMYGAVNQDYNKIANAFGTPLAFNSVPLGSQYTNLVRAGETTVGNLFCEACRRFMSTAFCMLDGGSFRALLPVGNITYNALATMFPFATTLVSLSVLGEDVLLGLENSVSRATATVVNSALLGSGSGRFMQVSGIRFVWNPFVPAGQRVLNVSILNVTTGNYDVLSPTTRYTMAIEGYAYTGGDGYTMFGASARVINLLPVPSLTQVLIVVSNFISSPAFTPSAYSLDGRIQYTSTSFPPILTSVSPSSVPVTGGVSITLTGYNIAAFSSPTATQYTTTVMLGALSCIVLNVQVVPGQMAGNATMFQVTCQVPSSSATQIGPVRIMIDTGSYAGSARYTRLDTPPFFNFTASTVCLLANSVYLINQCVCVSGYYLVNGVCQACSPGTYSNSLGATSCTVCPVNMYTTMFGSSQCQSCASGFYASQTGSTFCVFSLNPQLQQMIYVIAAIVASFIAITMAILFLYWKSIVMKSASSFFLLLILIWLMIMTIGAVFYTISPQQGDWVCNIRVWFTCLSASGALSVLLTKANRIKNIFSDTFRVKSEKDVDLLVTVGIVVGLQVVLLLGFSVASLSTSTLANSSQVQNGGGAEWDCTSTETVSFNVWLIFEFIYVACFITIGSNIAFQIRNTPAAFNESSHIMHCIVALTFFLTILVPINFIVNSDPNALMVVRGLGQSICALTMTLAIFAPKLYVILIGSADDKQQAATFAQRSSPGPMMSPVRGGPPVGGSMQPWVGGESGIANLSNYNNTSHPVNNGNHRQSFAVRNDNGVRPASEFQSNRSSFMHVPTSAVDQKTSSQPHSSRVAPVVVLPSASASVSAPAPVPAPAPAPAPGHGVPSPASARPAVETGVGNADAEMNQMLLTTSSSSSSSPSEAANRFDPMKPRANAW